MLALPTSDFSEPTGTPPDIKHNIKLEILCDWIEGSVLFGEEELSMRDVVDILTGAGIYDDKDLAFRIVGRAWDELKRRLGWIGDGNPFSFIRQMMKSICSWQENPAHSFLFCSQCRNATRIGQPVCTMEITVNRDSYLNH